MPSSLSAKSVTTPPSVRVPHTAVADEIAVVHAGQVRASGDELVLVALHGFGQRPHLVRDLLRLDLLNMPGELVDRLLHRVDDLLGRIPGRRETGHSRAAHRR